VKPAARDKKENFDMAEFVRPIPSWAKGQMDALLTAEGIRRDGHLDYSCGIFDEDDQLIATGSCYGPTLRCLAVDHRHQGEGLLNQIMGHLIQVQLERGNTHLFVYTKPSAARQIGDLGFYEIARVGRELVFLENRPGGFSRFLSSLEKGTAPAERTAAIVMNANPFTLGHRYLVERASRENDTLHVFLLSEEFGPIPHAVRRQLVEAGIRDLENVILHETDDYLISSATFPSYFLKDGDQATRAQAELDTAVFAKIAAHLEIGRRYVGQERQSHVTALYNMVLKQALPKLGIDCMEIPRLAVAGRTVSASTVRQAIHDGSLEDIRDLVPESTYRFFAGPEGAAVRAAIQREENVIHG